MSSRVRHDEEIGAGLVRVASTHLDQAVRALTLTELPGPDVFEARRRIKRARALVRLVPDPERTGEDPVLRHAARLLAPIRDHDVHRGLRRLADRGDADSSPMPFAPRVRLAARGAQTDLLGARLRLPTSDLAELDLDGYLDGVTASYRRLRRARPAEGDVEALHDWRRSVKVFAFQLRPMRDRSAGELALAARQAAELARLLGRHHDLALFAPDPDRDELDAIEAAARTIGAELSAPKVRAFRRTLADDLR